MSNNQQRRGSRGRGSAAGGRNPPFSDSGRGGRGQQFNDSGRGGRAQSNNSRGREGGGRGRSQYSSGRGDQRSYNNNGGQQYQQQQYHQPKFPAGNENYHSNRDRPRRAKGDIVLSKDEALKQQEQALRDVFDAKPRQEQFPNQSSTQSKLTLRPNTVNEHKKIWQPVSIQTNLFRITSKQEVAYQYDLQVRKGKGDNAPAAGASIYRKIFKKLQRLEQ
eukprot:TRINITY_DN2178_c0_g4_i1.p2 TRINITY_DN2178_c0_g4~~TRINITY_DN2178_c0_g4_i1.p2  ORF type:complete len:219 (+),score=18.17 TRINITY_DN2178_c0_g4_i1:80-736(+)